MKRRANNEGSCYQRNDGRWCGYYTAADGKRVYKYSKRQADIIEWLRGTHTHAQQSLSADAHTITVRDYLAHWHNIASRSLAPSTARQYDSIIRNHVLPTLGDMRLTKLRTDHIQALYVAAEDHGTGIETIHVMQAVLSKAFTQAVKWKLLTTSPTSGVDLPGRKRLKSVTPLTLPQARTFLTSIAGHPLEPLFALALATGMRHAELLGLYWSDIDWQTSTVHVRRQYTKDGYVVLKTKRSMRAIPIGVDTLAVLRRHWERQQFAGGGEVVFHGRRADRPLSQAHVRVQFAAALKAAGLPDIDFHDLRHTSASLMLAAGVPVNVVQERLGHSSASMTLSVYAHVMPGQQTAAADQLDAMLRP